MSAHRVARIAVATAAGLALADASVVVLALPPILIEFDASIEGVAAVIGAYTLALALTVPAAALWTRREGAAQASRVAMLAFAAASVLAGLAPTMGVLIGMRALQGVAAAGVLVAAFELLAGDRRTAVWTRVGIFGAALGPALGGVLTEFADWRAIFLVQAPVLAIAALVSRNAAGDGLARHDQAGRGDLSVRLLCYGLLSAALTGVLFLVVLLLVSVWAVSPLEAAAVVSALPLGALLGTRAPGDVKARAVVGSVLVAVGVTSLAFLSTDAVVMTLAPQMLAGIGMGMALPALAGGLIPERSSAQVASLLAVRHFGVTLALALVAPVAAAQFEHATDRVRERGAALILDARLPITAKLDLAGVATGDLEAVAPRDALRRSLERARRGAADGDEYGRLVNRLDETLVTELNSAFAPAFVICGALALLAAAGLLLSTRARLARAALAACAVAGAVIPAQAALAQTMRPAPVVIADPCEDRRQPPLSGLDGIVQLAALQVLDETACLTGSSREHLLLELIDDAPSLDRLLERLRERG